MQAKSSQFQRNSAIANFRNSSGHHWKKQRNVGFHAFDKRQPVQFDSPQGKSFSAALELPAEDRDEVNDRSHEKRNFIGNFPTAESQQIIVIGHVEEQSSHQHYQQQTQGRADAVLQSNFRDLQELPLPQNFTAGTEKDLKDHESDNNFGKQFDPVIDALHFVTGGIDDDIQQNCNRNEHSLSENGIIDHGKRGDRDDHDQDRAKIQFHILNHELIRIATSVFARLRRD